MSFEPFGNLSEKEIREQKKRNDDRKKKEKRFTEDYHFW